MKHARIEIPVFYEEGEKQDQITVDTYEDCYRIECIERYDCDNEHGTEIYMGEEDARTLAAALLFLLGEKEGER